MTTPKKKARHDGTGLITLDAGKKGIYQQPKFINHRSPINQEEPEHGNSWPAFLVWALMAGYVKPERVTERIVAEVESESTP